MKSELLKLVVIGIALVLAAASCRSGSGSGNTLEGSWVGDVEAMKEMNPELADNPMAELVFAMVGTMKIEFTGDKMIMEAMGQREEAGYKVVSSEGNTMVIEATDGDQAGEKTHVEFLPDNRVKLFDPDDEDEPAMVLKRAS